MSFTAFSHMSTWVFAIFLMYEHMSFTKFSHMSTWVFAIFLMYEKFEDMSFRRFRMRRIWIFSHVNLRFFHENLIHFFPLFLIWVAWAPKHRMRLIWVYMRTHWKLMWVSYELHVSLYENSSWEIFVRDWNKNKKKYRFGMMARMW